MNETTKTEQESVLSSVIKDILSNVSQEREKEIISRRFGLYDRKETLEQIGDMLGITRERVRQLEKAILVRLRLSITDGHIPSVISFNEASSKPLARNSFFALSKSSLDRKSVV